MRKASWIPFLTKRWFTARKNGGGSVVSVFAAAGIAVGVAALIVVLGVMNGFQNGYIESILEGSSFHIRVETTTIGIASQIAAVPGVRSVLPFQDIHCLASSLTRGATILGLRSVPGDAFGRDSGFAKVLGIETSFRLESGKIILGSETARQLGVETGDAVKIVAVAGDTQEGATTRSISATVQRVFKSGYYEFDSSLALVSFETSAALFPAGAEKNIVYGVKLTDRYADRAGAERIGAALGIDSSSIQPWRSYNRAFFGALRTEKTVMMLLVSLIFIVVGVNIHHAMRRTVAERTTEIAVVRALGGRSSDIKLIFILDGLAIGLGGALAGLFAGLAITWNINGIFKAAESVASLFSVLVARISGGMSSEFRIFSPQYFYLVDVPVRVSFIETVFVIAAAVASASLAAGSAASRLSRLDPAQVLHYE